jgi:hypothetical protein
MTKNYSPDGDTNRHPEKEMAQQQNLENHRDETDIERQERLMREQSEDTQKNSDNGSESDSDSKANTSSKSKTSSKSDSKSDK